MIVTVAADSSGLRTEKIDASTAEILIDVTQRLFGPGIVRDPDGVVISLETRNLVSGLYTWNPSALGETSLSSCMMDGLSLTGAKRTHNLILTICNESSSG